ncbi:MAG: Hint domain-containing protein [Pseudomonadota bacterium]
MPQFSFLIFAADNLTNPQNPGFLPAEDSTFRSDLVNGDQITWNGGGETAFVTVNDPTNASFDEAQSNQTLVNSVTFDGISYSPGQIVTPTYTIVFSGSDGNSYTMTSFNFSPNTNNEIPDAVFWEGNIPPAGTVLTVTSEINPTGANSREFSDFVACFCAGTMIQTDAGKRAVETLAKGDIIIGSQARQLSLWRVFTRRFDTADLLANPKLRPVRIMAGALGGGLPERDLWVSPQHRMLVRSRIAERMFGQAEALIAAIKLTELPGVFVDETATEVTYFHLLFDRHEIIYAEAAPTESFYTGPEALKGVSRETRDEILAMFPEIADLGYTPKPARYIPSGKLQKKLIERHVRNAKALLM